MAAYKIIDLKGTSLSGTPATIAGVHAAIASANCPIRLTGINYGGTEQKDAFVKFSLSSTSYVSDPVYGKVITVSNANEVSIADPA